MRVSHNVMLQPWPTHNLLGTPIGALTMQDVLSVVDSTIEHRDSGVFNLNPVKPVDWVVRREGVV